MLSPRAQLHQRADCAGRGWFYTGGSTETLMKEVVVPQFETAHGCGHMEPHARGMLHSRLLVGRYPCADQPSSFRIVTDPSVGQLTDDETRMGKQQ
jgi:hypothetical protein